MSLLIPNIPRRASLLAFWISLGLLFGGSLLTASLLWSSPSWKPVIAATVVWAILYFIPGVVASLYSGWRGLADYFAAGARLYVLAVCYFVAFSSVGMKGGSFRIKRPRRGESMWLKRRTLPASEYFSPIAFTGRLGGRRGWLRNHWSWARSSGNYWALAVLPFWALLRLFGSDARGSFPSKIYTLY